MWRLVLASSLLLTLALGAVAEAKCQVCVESVKAEKVDGNTSLRFTARAVHASALPETGTAVVMQVDGNRSKCINVSLRKVDESGGLATYVGSLTSFYGNTSLTGRVDIGGDIHEFAASFDGTPGTLQLITAATADLAAAAAAATVAPVRPVVITATPATAAPEVVAPQTATAFPTPTENPVLWLGAIVILATAAGALVDRRRALARATA